MIIESYEGIGEIEGAKDREELRVLIGSDGISQLIECLEDSKAEIERMNDELLERAERRIKSRKKE